MRMSWQSSLYGLVAGGVIAAAAPATAETYPARPVTIIMPFAAGSQPDAAELGKYTVMIKEAGIEPQ